MASTPDSGPVPIRAGPLHLPKKWCGTFACIPNKVLASIRTKSVVVQWLVFPPVTRKTRVQFPATEVMQNVVVQAHPL